MDLVKKKEVSMFLKHECGNLIKYEDILYKEGFDSMDKIKNDLIKKDLVEMGFNIIDKKNMMKAIHQIKNKTFHDNDNRVSKKQKRGNKSKSEKK